jgi:hypothetical protein
MPNCSDDHFACVRLIDWNRGMMYGRFANNKSSPCMFAIKFDINVDSQIIDALTK